jgi:hypothetical protein
VLELRGIEPREHTSERTVRGNAPSKSRKVRSHASLARPTVATATHPTLYLTKRDAIALSSRPSHTGQGLRCSIGGRARAAGGAARFTAAE